MAERHPATLGALLAIHGVEERKLALYGDVFLEAIAQAVGRRRNSSARLRRLGMHGAATGAGAAEIDAGSGPVLPGGEELQRL